MKYEIFYNKKKKRMVNNGMCIYHYFGFYEIFNYLLYKSDSYNEEVSPKRRLDDVIHLAELCIEVLQQNEEHHAEVSVNHHGN